MGSGHLRRPCVGRGFFEPELQRADHGGTGEYCADELGGQNSFVNAWAGWYSAVRVSRQLSERWNAHIEVLDNGTTRSAKCTSPTAWA